MGMELARIDNSEEQNWVHEMFGEYKAWIGLNDIDQENRIVNVDGCSLRYAPLDFSQFDFLGNEDCFQLSKPTGWNDNLCTRKFRFLCKKSDPSVRTPCGEAINTSS